MNRWGKRSTRAAVGIASLAMVLSACGGDGDDNGDGAEASDETFEFTVASNLPENMYITDGYKVWAERVTELSEGRITFKSHFGDSLVAYADIAPAVRDGQVEIGQVSPQATPDLFPMSPIQGVPGATTDIGGAIAAYRALYDSFEPFKQEWENNGLVPLFYQPTANIIVATKNELSSYRDMEGMRIRSSGPTVDVVKAVGASSVQLSTPEIYEGLQRGVIDAVTSQTLSGAASGSFAEVAPYIHETGMGPAGLIAVFMNKDVYDDLPDDLKEVLAQANREFDEGWVDVLVKDGAKACETVKEQGATLVDWTDAQKAEFAEAAFGATREAFIEGIGANGQDFWAAWEAEMSGYDGSLGEFSGSDIANCLGG